MCDCIAVTANPDTGDLSYHQEQKDDCGAEERRPCDRQGCGRRWVHEYHYGGRDFH